MRQSLRDELDRVVCSQPEHVKLTAILRERRILREEANDLLESWADASNNRTPAPRTELAQLADALGLDPRAVQRLSLRLADARAGLGAMEQDVKIILRGRELRATVAKFQQDWLDAASERRKLEINAESVPLIQELSALSSAEASARNRLTDLIDAARDEFLLPASDRKKVLSTIGKALGENWREDGS